MCDVSTSAEVCHDALVDLAREETFEAPDDLTFGAAVGRTSHNVVDRWLVVPHADDDRPIEGGVGLAVTAPVEAVPPSGPPGRGGDVSPFSSTTYSACPRYPDTTAAMRHCLGFAVQKTPGPRSVRARRAPAPRTSPPRKRGRRSVTRAGGRSGGLARVGSGVRSDIVYLTPPSDAAYWSLSRIVAVTSIELGRPVSICIGRRGSCRLASRGPVTIHATTPCAPAADRDAVAVVPLSTGDCSDQAGEWCGLKKGSRRKIFSV